MAPRKTSKGQSKGKQAAVTESAVGASSNGGLAVTPTATTNGTTNGAASSFEPTVEKNGFAPRLEQIQLRAYEIFMARGATHGHDWADWFRAEQELNGVAVEAH